METEPSAVAMANNPVDAPRCWRVELQLENNSPKRSDVTALREDAIRSVERWGPSLGFYTDGSAIARSKDGWGAAVMTDGNSTTPTIHQSYRAV